MLQTKETDSNIKQALQNGEDFVGKTAVAGMTTDCCIRIVDCRSTSIAFDICHDNDFLA